MNTLLFMSVSEQADSVVMQEFMSMISSPKQQQISKMRFGIDRKIRLYSEVLLRCHICGLLSLQNKDIHFAANEFGKPYLLNFPGIHFNISHTRNALAVCIGDEAVGVDIEKMNRADQEVARKVFTDNEIAYIYSKRHHIDRRFNEIWTRKESYAKWTGMGWSSDAPRADVLYGIYASRITTLQIGRYVVSVCSDSVNKYSESKHITEQELYITAHDLLI